VIRAGRYAGAVRRNRSIPAATVIPVLVYPDVRAAVQWLTEAFGFAERLRIGADHRSQMRIGADGAVIVADVRHERQPPQPGVVTHLSKVRVADVDAQVQRARAYGARIVQEPEEFEYGEREATIEDLAGHRWQFTQTMRDVAPREWGGVAVEPGSPSFKPEQAGSSDVGADGKVSEELVAAYREQGFVRVRGVLAPDQVGRFRAGAEAFLVAHRAESLEKQGAFTQLVNVWQRDDNLRALTFDARLGRIAEQLAGFPLRLWHDQMLVKEPHNNVATEFHQDRPYWPHAGDGLPLSAWIALVDVPPERGCMTFLPGTQNRTGLRRQDLHHEEDLFTLDPALRWIPRVTVPLRAGDCTFHSGYTGHMALPNRTDLARLAYVVIYMDEATTYSGAEHIVTDPLGLVAGDRLDGDTFPRPWA
jgi:uncharacterized glyoxalase superfamily protein PhnB